MVLYVKHRSELLQPPLSSYLSPPPSHSLRGTVWAHVILKSNDNLFSLYGETIYDTWQWIGGVHGDRAYRLTTMSGWGEVRSAWWQDIQADYNEWVRRGGECMVTGHTGWLQWVGEERWGVHGDRAYRLTTINGWGEVGSKVKEVRAGPDIWIGKKDRKYTFIHCYWCMLI